MSDKSEKRTDPPGSGLADVRTTATTARTPAKVGDMNVADLQALVADWTIQSYEKPVFARAVEGAVEPQLANLRQTLAESHAAIERLASAGGPLIRPDRDDQNLDGDGGWAETNLDRNRLPGFGEPQGVRIGGRQFTIPAEHRARLVERHIDDVSHGVKREPRT